MVADIGGRHGDDANSACAVAEPAPPVDRPAAPSDRCQRAQYGFCAPGLGLAKCEMYLKLSEQDKRWAASAGSARSSRRRTSTSRVPEFIALAHTIRYRDLVPTPSITALERPIRSHQHPPASTDQTRLRIPQPRRAHRHGIAHPRWPLPTTTPTSSTKPDLRKRQEMPGSL